jgi:hypothetical protein
MPAEHHDGHVHHAQAANPTLSLLRLSAGERLLGTGLVLGLLWMMVLATIA